MPARLQRMLPILIFIVLAIAVGLGMQRGFANSAKPLVDPSHPKVLANEQPAVTLYSAEWCSYCSSARAYFKRKSIPYIEKDIEKNALAGQEFKQLGGQGVPFIVVDNHRLYGFDRAQFNTAYLSYF